MPVIDGLQAQGDLIVIPLDMVPTINPWWGTERYVPRGGVELVRGEAGNNPHTLVADPWTCKYTTNAQDPLVLGIAAFANTAPVYLIHPEHGGTGVAPGTWLVRRQQERRQGAHLGRRLRGNTVLVAD
ncbi:hypothetical protein GC106_25240 [Kibdelosporangium sp. 4NS15]|uniref:Uncharacterized protein n=1 Tax=Kibdelosporangium persicum TaxID=2698649 RepID=A0ABX2F268_9PSEU|nr:hypothetical protein [Kibdelosporangium persicum]